MKQTLLALMLLIPSLAFSQEVGQGFYLGAGYGAFAYSTNPAFNDSAAYGNLIEKSSGGTLKVYGGYQFNRILAAEIIYSDYGTTIGYVYDGSGGQETVTQSPSSIAAAINAGYSFDNGLRPFALFGISSVYLDADYAFIDTDSPLALKYGVGVQYTPPQLSLLEFRLAYESDTFFADTKTSNEPYYFQLNSMYLGVALKY